jgi:hypothetical protein
MAHKVYFLNDTSGTKHAGCRAVMRSLRHHLRDVEIIGTHRVGGTSFDSDLIDACDVVFVNGEGTIHHNSARANLLLSALAAGQERRKRTFLVNALFQQDHDRYPGTLERLDWFSVREPASARCAGKFGGRPAVLLDSAADQLFLGSGRPLFNASGVLKGGTHPASPAAGIFDRIEVPELSISAGSFEDLVATLRTADVYLTGQHHGVYAAGLAGIPFVAAPSNSHKIEALIAWAGLPIPICRSPDEVAPAIEFARSNYDIYRHFNEFLLEHSVFTAGHLMAAL